MHPLLGKFLNLKRAQETLRRAEAGGELASLASEERFYLLAASAFPDQRSALLDARSQRASPETQQALLILSAHAAARAVLEDPQLGAFARAAWDALMSEGATEVEAAQYLADLLIEEAFEEGADVDAFDQAMLRETLETVPRLSKLTSESVQELIRTFVNQAPAASREDYRRAAEELLGIAWEDGPLPIQVEHVQAAAEALRAQGRNPKVLHPVLDYLAQQGLVGTRRKDALVSAVNRL